MSAMEILRKFDHLTYYETDDYGSRWVVRVHTARGRREFTLGCGAHLNSVQKFAAEKIIERKLQPVMNERAE